MGTDSQSSISSRNTALFDEGELDRLDEVFTADVGYDASGQEADARIDVIRSAAEQQSQAQGVRRHNLRSMDDAGHRSRCPLQLASAAPTRRIREVRAEPVAAGCTAVASLVLFDGPLLSTSTFDLLVWAALSWLVVRAVRTGQERLWRAIGALLGIGLGQLRSTRPTRTQSRDEWCGGAARRRRRHHTICASRAGGVGLLDERHQLWRRTAMVLLDLFGVVSLHPIQGLP